MVTMTSYTALLLVLVSCWCYVDATHRKVTFSDDADDYIPTTTDYRQLCSDRRKNQDESDIDCGGIKCPKCEDMKHCKIDCDCISGSCKDNRCSSFRSCEDGIRNQDESDVDCGGVFCPKCTLLKTCKSECDCVSGVCKDNKCVTPHVAGGCHPTCKNNGECIDNKCSCPKGFRGVTCEAESWGLCSAEDLSDSDPIVKITFGHGSQTYSHYTPKDFHFTTTYKQQFQGRTSDGYFGLINTCKDSAGGTWHTNIRDHTGDKGGYMLFVNADYQAGEFYRGTVKNLCVGQRYEFSVYLANLGMPGKGLIKPNVLFQVRTTVGNELLAELSSGDILEYNTFTWKKYGLSFTATSQSVVLLMISNAAGGVGNDLVIDDIQLRTCGRTPTSCHEDI